MPTHLLTKIKLEGQSPNSKSYHTFFEINKARDYINRKFPDIEQDFEKTNDSFVKYFYKNFDIYGETYIINPLEHYVSDDNVLYTICECELTPQSKRENEIIKKIEELPCIQNVFKDVYNDINIICKSSERDAHKEILKILIEYKEPMYFEFVDSINSMVDF